MYLLSLSVLGMQLKRLVSQSLVGLFDGISIRVRSFVGLRGSITGKAGILLLASRRYEIANH